MRGDKEVPARLASMLLMLVESDGVMTAEGPMIPARYTHKQLASIIGANRASTTGASGQLQEGGPWNLGAATSRTSRPQGAQPSGSARGRGLGAHRGAAGPYYERPPTRTFREAGGEVVARCRGRG